MKKTSCLKEIQKRLPDDIVIEGETLFEFTEDEFVATLSWIKYFNEHYRIHGKNEGMMISLPLVSKRLRLDFAL